MSGAGMDGKQAGAERSDPETRTSLEARLGHRFIRSELLTQALTHRSASAATRMPGGRSAGLRRGAGSNERLEFIGDRVLGLAVAEWLLERFPAEQEGELGPRHAALVSRDELARIAAAIGLDGAIALAPDAARAGVGALANVMADALEAVFGAMFLDAGLDPVRQFVRTHFERALARHEAPPKDAKTGLQEWLLGRGAGLPLYTTIASDGPSHAPRFEIEASGAGATGRGVAGSKREAERLAAADLLAQLTAGAGRRKQA